MIIVPNRLGVLPTGPARIDTRNPLARGIVGYWHALPNGLLVSAIPGIAGVAKGTGGGQVLTPKGWNFGAIATSVAGTIPTDPRIRVTDAITIIVDGRAVGTGANSFAWLTNENLPTSNTGFGFWSPNGAGTIRAYLRVGSSWPEQVTGITPGAVGQVGLSYDGATFWAGSNGRRVNSQSITGAISMGSTPMYLCDFSDASGAPGNGGFRSISIWNRALSAGEWAEYYLNPAQVLRAPSRRFYFDAGTSGGISGIGGVTLADVTTTATGTLQLKAAGAATLQDVSTSGPSKLYLVANSSAQLADVAGSATGQLGVKGASSATLDSVVGSATGALAIKATVGVTLADVAPASVGNLPLVGGGSAVLEDVTTSATGVGLVSTTGQSNAALADVAANAAATVRISGVVNATLADVVGVAPSRVYLAAAASAQLADVQGAATATVRLAAAASAVLANVTTAAAGQAGVEPPPFVFGPRPGGSRHSNAGRPGTTNNQRPRAIGGGRRRG